jgi:uncharacterized protein
MSVMTRSPEATLRDAPPRGSAPHRVRTRGSLPVVVGVALALFATESLVIITIGEPSTGVRLARLVAIVLVTAALWSLWFGLQGRGRALLEAAIGLTAILSGGVATLARSRDVPVVTAMLGAVVTAAGLVLLVAAFVGLIRSVRAGWRRVIAIPALLLAFVYLATPIAMGVLVTNRARPVLGDRTPADVGLASENLSIRTPDATLLAWYVASRNGDVVLVLPGSGSTRDDVLDHAAMLADHGYGVLMVDVAGHGGSTGEPMEFGWGAERYLPAALDIIDARPDVTGRIAAMGLSMGAEQALTLAAVDPRVAAVVSDGASGRTWQDAWNRPDPVVARALMFPFNWLNTTTADVLADASPPMPLVEAMRAIGRRPVLLISTGTGAEREANQVFADVSAHASLWELPDAAHTAGLRSEPAEYERRVTAFLDRSLGRAA